MGNKPLKYQYERPRRHRKLNTAQDPCSIYETPSEPRDYNVRRFPTAGGDIVYRRVPAPEEDPSRNVLPEDRPVPKDKDPWAEHEAKHGSDVEPVATRAVAPSRGDGFPAGWPYSKRKDPWAKYNDEHGYKLQPAVAKTVAPPSGDEYPAGRPVSKREDPWAGYEAKHGPDVQPVAAKTVAPSYGDRLPRGETPSSHTKLSSHQGQPKAQPWTFMPDFPLPDGAVRQQPATAKTALPMDNARGAVRPQSVAAKPAAPMSNARARGCEDSSSEEDDDTSSEEESSEELGS